MTPGPLLADRVTVVTGGGGGIGRGIATTFAEHGATVHIVEIDATRAADTVAAIDATGGNAIAHVMDATNHDAVLALAASVGAVDALVNNVGHYLFKPTNFVDSTPAEWDALHRVNLLHVFSCTHAFLPAMIDAGRGGSIISVSTVEAFRGKPEGVAYAAYKGAITQFTKSLALEVGSHGIRVNAIAPDLTETLQVPYDRWVPDDQQHMIPTWVPVGRFGTPADIAGVALFLASELSSFVTGTTVHADGGSYAAGGWFRSTHRDGWTNRPLAP